MEVDLIENLHELSNTAKRLQLNKYNISQLIHIHNYYCIDDFTDTESYVFQNDVLNADDRKISLILKNFNKAIESNCGNNIDLEQYSIDDTFEISYATNANVKNVTKLYTVKNQFPKDNHLFKCYWLKHFIKECRQIIKNIKSIVDQPNKSKANQNNEISSAISYEYLNAFCNAITNQALIFENSFITTYRCDITHYTDYFKNEINQNILNLKLQKREDYLALLIHKIESTPFYNFDKTLTEVFLSKYNVDVNNFPKELNKELYDLLNTFPNRIDLKPEKQSEITQIQLSFYAYFSKIEAMKMVEFLKSKKINSESKLSKSKLLTNKSFTSVIPDKNKQDYILQLLEDLSITLNGTSILTQRKKGALRGVVEALRQKMIIPNIGLSTLCNVFADKINLELKSKLDASTTSENYKKETLQYIKNNPIY